MAYLLRARRNPSPIFLGEDPELILGAVAGAGIVGWANDSVVNPAAKKFLPGIFANTGILGRLGDAGTTLATTKVVSKGVGMFRRPWGRYVELGGSILVGTKILGALLPNVFPSFGQARLPFHSGAAAALPAGAAALTGSAALPGAAFRGGPPEAATLTTSTQGNPELYSGV